MPFKALAVGGMVRKCGNEGCHRAIEDAAEVQPVQIAQPTNIAAAMTAPAPIARPSALPVVHMPAAVPGADTPADVYLAGMRERLSAVRIALAALAKLKAEEALLERMLAAAEPPPN